MNVYFWSAVAAAAAIGIVARFAGYRTTQAVGIGLIAWPFARLAVNLGASWGDLLTYTVLQPIPEWRLWRMAGRAMWHSFLIPFVGLLLATGSLQGAAREARLKWHATPSRDLLNGFGLFLFVVAGYLLVVGLLTAGLFERLQTGDESRVFENMTPLLAIAISAAAGISEEFVYRGILLGILARWMPLPAAVVTQAVVFGLAHAGYGTLSHILAPAVFGLFAGWVAVRLGIVPAMIIHGLIDVVFFGLGMLGRDPTGGYWLVAGVLAPTLAAALMVRLGPVRALLPASGGWRRTGRKA